MSAEMSEIRESIREANKAAIKAAVSLFAVMFSLFVGIGSYVVVGIDKRVSDGEQRDHLVATELALQKLTISSHDNQLRVQNEVVGEMRRSMQDILLQMTVSREALATIKERVTYTSDRIEGLAEFLRKNSRLETGGEQDRKKDLLDMTPRRDRTERNNQ